MNKPLHVNPRCLTLLVNFSYVWLKILNTKNTKLTIQLINKMLLMKIMEKSGKFYETIMEIVIKTKDKRPNVHPKYGLIQEQKLVLVFPLFCLISHYGYSFFFYPHIYTLKTKK